MPDEQVVEQEPSLADWKKARNEGVVEEPVKEVPEPEEQETEKTEDKPKQKGWNGAQKKIDRLVKHNAELEKRAEAAERRAAEIEAAKGKDQAKPKADDEPKEVDFNGDTMAFLKAQARWEVREEIRTQEEKRVQDTQRAKTQAIFDAHNERVAVARANHDDYEEALTATKTPWNPDIPSEVRASEAFSVALYRAKNSGELLYHFAKHPELLDALKGLDPEEVAMEMGVYSKELAKELAATSQHDDEEEVEEQTEEPETKKKLPTPITPVGRGASAVSKELKDLPLSEYKKARNAGRVR